MLQQGMAFEFLVFLPPLCSTAIDDMALLVVKEGAQQSINAPLEIKTTTVVSSKLHYDEVV